MYVMKSTREALLAQEKIIVTGDCCYLNPLIRRIIRFIGERVKTPPPPPVPRSRETAEGFLAEYVSLILDVTGVCGRVHRKSGQILHFYS